MQDHMSKSLTDLADDILSDGIIDADEVSKIRERVYADGIIDREEADFLFQLNDGASGKDNDPAWKAFFVEAITDHVLKDETSPDILDEDEAQYLIKKIEADDQVDDVELELLVNISAKAKECPPSFNTFVLGIVKKTVIADGIVDAGEVEMMKKVIYGSGSGSGEGVDRTEADMLFDINDATTANEGHDSSWKDFFVEAIAKHVLDDEESPGEIDEAEGDWLIARIEGDDDYDDNEKALLAYIKANAKEIAGKLKFKIEMLGN